MSALDAALDRFVARLRARLATGAVTYGDSSFDRPPAEILDEVQQELEDVCGWGLILWVRLERQRERMRHADGCEGIVTPEVRIRTWTRASDEEERTGLLGYLSIFYGDLVLDSITLRRATDGRLTLSFPERTDRSGRRHSDFLPRDDAARRAFENAILGGLVADERVGP